MVALLYVFWDQTREPPQLVDAGRFTNLQNNPVKLSTTVDWVVTQIPSFCEQASDRSEKAQASCVEYAQTRTSTCRRGVYDRFPSVVASEAVFRDVSITLINCLVQAP
nr:hypothetical protein [Marinobacter salexigens]